MTIQSFYIAKHGEEAWAKIKRVPRLDWMDFLRWYRTVVDLPIRNGSEVTDIDYDAEGVTISLSDGGSIRTRLLILATGMDGGGAWNLPDIVSDNVPETHYNHSCKVFDETRLAGLDVGVIGAGAAGYDMAVTALEAGAKSVSMFMRRSTLPMIDYAREFETAGQLNHGHELSDLTKWRISSVMGGLSQSPAEHHFLKALTFSNFEMHLGSPWQKVVFDGGKIQVDTPKGHFDLDFVLLATGIKVDLWRRPELKNIARNVALWRHRFVPPVGDGGLDRLNFPYLDDCYRFTEREPGIGPGLNRIFAFNGMAPLSMGTMSAVSISSHKFGVPRVASGVTSMLFREQENEILPKLRSYSVPGIVLPPRARKMIGLDSEPRRSGSTG